MYGHILQNPGPLSFVQQVVEIELMNIVDDTVNLKVSLVIRKASEYESQPHWTIWKTLNIDCWGAYAPNLNTYKCAFKQNSNIVPEFYNSPDK